jgi:hypothetical protein
VWFLIGTHADYDKLSANFRIQAAGTAPDAARYAHCRSASTAATTVKPE